jgi:hypothetical protein
MASQWQHLADQADRTDELGTPPLLENNRDANATIYSAETDSRV